MVDNKNKVFLQRAGFLISNCEKACKIKLMVIVILASIDRTLMSNTTPSE